MYHEPDLWVSIQEINKKKRQKEIINKHSKLLISPGLIFVQMTIFGVLIFGGKFMIGGDFASQSGDYFWYDLIFWSSYFRGGVYDWRRFCIPKWGYIHNTNVIYIIYSYTRNQMFLCLLCHKYTPITSKGHKFIISKVTLTCPKVRS